MILSKNNGICHLLQKGIYRVIQTSYLLPLCPRFFFVSLRKHKKKSLDLVRALGNLGKEKKITWHNHSLDHGQYVLTI